MKHALDVSLFAQPVALQRSVQQLPLITESIEDEVLYSSFFSQIV